MYKSANTHSDLFHIDSTRVDRKASYYELKDVYPFFYFNLKLNLLYQSQNSLGLNEYLFFKKRGFAHAYYPHISVKKSDKYLYIYK